ncbi:glycosyltransferase [Paenibacillus sp. MMS20-IR301]|uniref:tetratricopeptide repeat-containing glycosyltransferase family 2 protein n=1 Tax=Paenibacillus sp. MMS20-IR301 TaxID=2895946 RepID=UPI0028EE20A1|nr:glycosyltransferase [Paenibacillus sp. MMS20-IR301]WNS43219.1 glycosyltransferase [Paenibacillus sp. MMS20-IR301]
MTKSRKPLISLCMIVKNEADTLARCLTSVRGVADELIVVDTGSTDSTVSIARSFGARIITHRWSGDFAAARNAGLAKARGSWILVLDADEELEPGSKDELRACAQHMEYEAFWVRIHNHKGTERSSQTLTVNPILRMFRSRPEYRFSGIIHEQIASVIVEKRPAAAMHLSTVIVHHYGYADGVVEKKDKITRNIRLLQEQLERSPGDAFHHFNMAVEYMRLGEYNPALEHLRTSLAGAEPDTSYLHLLYKYEIRCLAALGDSRSALEACEQGIALFPDYPDLHHIKGALLLQVSARSEAKAALHRALDIGVSPPAYHTENGIGTYLTQSLLGQVCQQTGDETEAIACFTRAAQLHPAPWPLIARLLRQFKCAGRETEICGWLADHLPRVLAEERQSLVQLLVRDGCYAAAAEVLGAGTVERTAARDAEQTEQRDAERTEQRDAERMAARAVEWDAQGTAGEGDDGEASLLRLLRMAEETPAAQITTGDIAALLLHPAVSRTVGTAITPAQPWLALADRVLAELQAASPYAPAAAAVRMMLPLPLIDE